MSAARTATTKKRPTRLTSIAKAAECADVSPRTIRRWIASGRLPGYRVGPRLLKVSLDDVEQLAQQIPAGLNYDG